MNDEDGVKVCHISTVHSADDIRIYHKECRSLSGAGYKATLIARRNTPEENENIDIILLPDARNRILRMLVLTVRALVIAINRRAEIYHVHDAELLPAAAALRIFLKKAVIYDMHENMRKKIPTKTWLPRVIRWLALGLFQIIEKSCLRYIDYLILAEDGYTEDYKAYSDTTVIHNYPITEYFDTAATNKRIGNKDGFSAVYVGRIARSRGIIEMIEVMKLLHEEGYNIVLELAGSIASEEGLHKAVEDAEKAGLLKYNGVISPGEIAALLRNADVGLSLIHPVGDHQQTIHTKIYEYMIAGLPFIASNFYYYKRFVKMTKSGICVDPLDPEEAKEAIKELIDNPLERIRMGNAGKSAVIKEYNWAHEENKLLGVYRELILRRCGC